MIVAPRINPRSATLPAMGAAITPAAPAKENSAISPWLKLYVELDKSRGIVVQNRLNAANKKKWHIERLRNISVFFHIVPIDANKEK